MGENIRRGQTGKHQSFRTHCPYGHEYDEKNTRFYRGRRSCKACDTIQSRERRKAAR